MPLITRTEYVEIDGVPLATPAWEVLDLTPLWDAAAVRGRDRLIPGAAGVIPYRRRVTVTVRSLPMIIMGEADQEGVLSCPDEREQLWTNVQYLLDNVVAIPVTADGTRVAILHAPDGSTPTADVHVNGPLQFVPLGKKNLRAVLTLSVPVGAFA